MIKLPLEELCKAMKCQFQGTSEKGCQAFPECLALAHAEAVQEALLAKLRETKPEDLMEEIAKWLMAEDNSLKSERPDYADWLWAENPMRREYFLCKANALFSLITPFLTAKLEAAEKAGMREGRTQLLAELRPFVLSLRDAFQEWFDSWNPEPTSSSGRTKHSMEDNK